MTSKTEHINLIKQNCIGKGFTLVELLVVISIIALLLAILMPSLQKAREQAKGLACASQTRQMGIALSCYTVDYDNWYPAMSFWWSSVERGKPKGIGIGQYLKDTKNVFLCPSDRDAKYTNKDLSYGYNWIALQGECSTVLPPKRKATNLSQPSSCVAICDTWDTYGTRYEGYKSFWVNPTMGTSPSRIGDRHRNGANVVWCDGHTSWMNFADLDAKENYKTYWWRPW